MESTVSALARESMTTRPHEKEPTEATLLVSKKSIIQHQMESFLKTGRGSSKSESDVLYKT